MVTARAQLLKGVALKVGGDKGETRGQRNTNGVRGSVDSESVDRQAAVYSKQLQESSQRGAGRTD
jgi:hypothetical protein